MIYMSKTVSDPIIYFVVLKVFRSYYTGLMNRQE